MPIDSQIPTVLMFALAASSLVLGLCKFKEFLYSVGMLM